MVWYYVSGSELLWQVEAASITEADAQFKKQFGFKNIPGHISVTQDAWCIGGVKAHYQVTEAKDG